MRWFSPKLNFWARVGFVNVFILLAGLVIFEGAASYVLFLRDFKQTLPLAERQHTQYDSYLGWVNIPNVHVPHMYGPGVYLRTNGQGFRNNRDFDAQVPAGKSRIICSGNSFTLGYGVDNDHAWCQRLTDFDPRLETVNMGQGGYGVDQAYLWFKRDTEKLGHHVHLLAFVTPDFRRMENDQFHGYGKPVIQIENGSLVVKNVPVPRLAYRSPWLVSNFANLQRLRSVELFTRVGAKFGVAVNQPDAVIKKEQTQKILLKIFEDLKRVNDLRSSKLVLVYLPLESELEGSGSEEWLDFIEHAAKSLDISLINVETAFRALPPAEVAGLFIPKDGHLNDKGNEFVANVIYHNLKPYLTSTLAVF